MHQYNFVFNTIFYFTDAGNLLTTLLLYRYKVDSATSQSSRASFTRAASVSGYGEIPSYSHEHLLAHAAGLIGNNNGGNGNDDSGPNSLVRHHPYSSSQSQGSGGYGSSSTIGGEGYTSLTTKATSPRHNNGGARSNAKMPTSRSGSRLYEPLADSQLDVNVDDHVTDDVL
jgi:hypothetical protein